MKGLKNWAGPWPWLLLFGACAAAIAVVALAVPQGREGDGPTTPAYIAPHTATYTTNVGDHWAMLHWTVYGREIIGKYTDVQGKSQYSDYRDQSTEPFRGHVKDGGRTVVLCGLLDDGVSTADCAFPVVGRISENGKLTLDRTVGPQNRVWHSSTEKRFCSEAGVPKCALSLGENATGIRQDS